MIVFTTHADQELEQECLVLGADQVLIKPIVPKKLQQAINQCLLMPGYRSEYNSQLSILKKQVEVFLKQEKLKNSYFFPLFHHDLFLYKLPKIDKRVAMLTKNFGHRVPEIRSHDATEIRPRYVLRPARNHAFGVHARASRK